ncbi:MAG: DUF1295 domain-containing protein [Myxococcales bacterium]|nr:DUF1295 domain-containing protein [Myxococcales bacterium]
MGKAVVTISVCIALAAGIAWAGAQGGVAVWGVPVMALCGGLAFLVQWVAFVPSFAHQTERYYDLTGSVTYLTTTWLAVASSGTTHPRALLVGGAVSVWALRLGSFLFRRVRREGKDGRFDAIKTSAPRFLVAWTVQGLWVFLTSCAALATITVEVPAALGLRDALGGAIWVLGFAIEVVADRQKSAFKAQHPGRFIDTGLWSWSRHPNYFGEIVLWVGIAIVASSTLRGWQWATMISPIFVVFLLTKVSGIPMLEERADDRWGEQDDYRAYKARTSVLVPWPPGR